MSAVSAEKTDLKRRIRTLQSEISTALAAKEGVKAKRLRRKVKLLKRATRRAPEAAPAATEPSAG